MINPEKILGGLIRSGSRRRGIGSLVTSGVGLGLVGVAMEAVEHLMNKTDQSQAKSPPVPPPVENSALSPARSQSRKMPPPPPGVKQEHSLTHDSGSDHQETILLIRAMIAAANADNVIDSDERNRILGKLKEIKLNDEELSFITHELLSPSDLNTIIKRVKTPETAKQIYAVSLLTINADTDTEKKYLKTLREQTGLDDSVIQDLHKNLGVEVPD